MPKSKVFSGPPANKVTASTLAAAVATMFWTIAAHTFLRDMAPADMATYITTSTIILTFVIGFLVPESQAYASHAVKRLRVRRPVETIVDNPAETVVDNKAPRVPVGSGPS